MSTEVQWLIILSLVYHGIIYLIAVSFFQVVTSKEMSARNHLFSYPATYILVMVTIFGGIGGTLKFLAALVMSAIGLYLLFLAFQAFRADPKLWEENRQARRLARKMNNEKELAPEEKILFEELRNKGAFNLRPIGLAYSRKTGRFVTHVWELSQHRTDEWVRKPLFS